MKKLFLLPTLLLLIFSCKTKSNKTKKHIQQNEFAIVIHGGAGTILKKNITPEKEAIKIDNTILKNEEKSIDAVVKTIQIMEESPIFNAGKGLFLLIIKLMNWMLL